MIQFCRHLKEKFYTLWSRKFSNMVTRSSRYNFRHIRCKIFIMRVVRLLNFLNHTVQTIDYLKTDLIPLYKLSENAHGDANYHYIPAPPVQHYDYPKVPMPQQPPGRSGNIGNANPYDEARFQQQMECKNPDCDMFGRWEWNGYCSQCFKRSCPERN